MAISRMNMERQMRNMGGIMGLEDQRQGYFLGKLVKKATRAVKKVVKSPVGKAALLGAVGFGIPGTQFGGLFGRAAFGGAAKGLLGNYGIGSTLSTRLPSLFAKGIGPNQDPGLFRGLMDKFGGLSLGQKLLLGGGAAAVAAPFLMGGDEEVEEETPFTQTPDSISSIVNMARNQDPSLRFLPQPKFVRNFYAAEGGLADIPREGYESGERVSGILKLLSRMTPFGAARELGSNIDMDTLKKLSMFTPVGAAKKAGEGLANMDMNILKRLSMFTPAGAAVNLGKKIANMKDGGMIDMGGLEKDYREGGFVPIGAEERADDVPARLSKNEFVFTADAVRAAGEGDIDKGAEVMQNMMDNLEAGGTISEESQGMENPAQAMFDQAQMLESRIA